MKMIGLGRYIHKAIRYTSQHIPSDAIRITMLQVYIKQDTKSANFLKDITAG